MESLAEEVADSNVQVELPSPGETYTHMTDQVLAAGDRAGWRELKLPAGPHDRRRGRGEAN